MYNSSKAWVTSFLNKNKGLEVRVVSVELGKAQGCSSVAAAKEQP